MRFDRQIILCVLLACFAAPITLDAKGRTICGSLLDHLARKHLLHPTSDGERVYAIRDSIMKKAEHRYQENATDPDHGGASEEARRIETARGLFSEVLGRQGVRPHQMRRHYFPLMEVIDGKRLTLHIGYDDVFFGLELPREGEETPWQLLNPEERAHLTYELTQSLRTHFYDRDVVNDGARGYNDLYRAFREVGPAGFRPLPFHAHKHLADCPVGICRLSNPALVGALGELGLPASDVRLETGYRPDNLAGHMWYRIRFSPRGEWIEGDATPDAGRSIISSIVHGPRLRYGDLPYDSIFLEDRESINFLRPQDLSRHPDAIPIEGLHDYERGD